MYSGDLQRDVQAALGTTELAPLQMGGQKLVYSVKLAGVPAVVKVVPVPETDYAEQVLERARREVELLSTVESEFVVAVLSEAVEIGDRPEAICWVEEYLDGSDLRDLAASFPWTPQEVWTLIRDVASGLCACHELDVVHRDLSPGNVRRRASGRFALMDPGLARHLGKAALTGLYQPGTYGYMTPEHVPGGHPTPASDVFALGILAFQALTASVPIAFAGDEDDYYARLRTWQAASVRDARADTPPELAAVIDRCLQRQAARRYLDGQELIDDLPARDVEIKDPGSTS